MGVKTYKPVTPGLRWRTGYTFEEITREEPEKSLVRGKKRISARNNQGRKTVRGRGGGHKKRYRIVDFRRWDKLGVPAKVAAIEYDPNRSARIALLHYLDGEKRYIIWPEGLKVGDVVVAGPDASISVGNALPLENIPTGTFVHAIELEPGKGAKIARSAGTYAQVMAKEGNYVYLKMPSGEVRLVHKNCYATIGQVGLAEHENIDIGKAGRHRWMGRKPKVRGMAMNPVDHPLGGGEGRGKGHHPVSPTGIPAKGYRTRKKKKPSSRFIVKRRYEK